MSLEINTMTRPGDLVSYVSDPGSYYPIEADKNCNLVGMTPAEIYRVCKYVSDIVRPMIGKIMYDEKNSTVLIRVFGDLTAGVEIGIFRSGKNRMDRAKVTRIEVHGQSIRPAGGEEEIAFLPMKLEILVEPLSLSFERNGG